LLGNAQEDQNDEGKNGKGDIDEKYCQGGKGDAPLTIKCIQIFCPVSNRSISGEFQVNIQVYLHRKSVHQTNWWSG